MIATPQILFEDTVLVAILKPALIHSVAQQGSTNPSVGAWLIERDAALSDVSDTPGDGGLINRLDFETSGILIGAKTREAWNSLRCQYEQREVIKNYLAVVEGRVAAPLEVEGFIGGRYRGSRKVTLSPAEAPRTIFTASRISPVAWPNASEGCSLVNVQTRTGARHQVRVHCSSIGHPLAGDALYGGRENLLPAGAPGFILHAREISFLHPEKHERIAFQAPLPPYLRLG